MHPYLTAEIPGCGGVIKESPDDFVVEEIPSYQPCGSGEHCYIKFEKRGITTLEAISRIARKLKVSERDIGYAGMKDAVGVTRQTVSVQGVVPECVNGIEIDSVKIISAQRHTNKLKLGHLKGNRFTVIVRQVSDAAELTVPAVLEQLSRIGVPNYFGYQRYGAQNNSHLVGAAMLRKSWYEAVGHLIGDENAVRDEEWRGAIAAYRNGNIAESLKLLPRHLRTERDVLRRLAEHPLEYEKAFSSIHPRMKFFYLSAVQSFLFDQVVARRINELNIVKAGDYAFKHDSGACFLVIDEAAESIRAASLDISPSGPMFGSKMKQPEGVVADIECEVLESSGLDSVMFGKNGGAGLDGERRPLRVPLGDLEWDLKDSSLMVTFFLPKGSYATSMLREITKTF